jgi:hypothetical protein
MTHALLIAVLGLTLMATAGDAMAQVAGSVTLGTSVEVTKAIAVGHRASKLIGAAVYNDREERGGTIDDLIISPDRFVSFAVLSVGGFLGLGTRHVAIPVEQLRDLKGRITLAGATREAFRALPEFTYAD